MEKQLRGAKKGLLEKLEKNGEKGYGTNKSIRKREKGTKEGN